MSNSHGSNSGTVQAFSIGSNGSLIPIGSSPGINAPFNVVVDGEGSNLYLYGNDNYIYEYRLDKATGAISDNLRIGAHALPGSMLLLGGSGPVSYTSKFAFVSSTGDNKITSYGVAADGSFTTRQSVVAPLGPFSLSGAPWGDELIASSAAPNPALTPYAISSTGSLIAGFSFGQGVTSGGVLMAPSGNFAFDLDPTNNLLYTYVRGSNFWGTQYVLINGVPKAGVATGSLPGAITSDGVGRFLFVANKGSKSISVFGNLPEPQELTSQFTAPYPDGSPYQLTATPLKLAVDVNGEYLYVLCDDNTVRAFSIDYYSGGHIKEVSYVTLTGTATGLTASQTGRLLYATDSLGVHGYVVSSTGVISAGVSGSSAILSNVNGVYADPSGLFLYATTSTAGAGYVYGYALDPFGVLTAIAANPIATSNQPSSVSFRTSIQ
jgi:6-phosphogluconolactonase (cycloisomerase 2 family)